MAGGKAKQTQIPQQQPCPEQAGLEGLQQVEPAHDQHRKDPGSVHLQKKINPELKLPQPGWAGALLPGAPGMLKAQSWFALQSTTTPVGEELQKQYKIS